MKIIFKSINDLVPHEDVEYNRMRRIVASIARNRYILKPIIIEKSRNIIIDGHHRFYALRILGSRQIPVVEAEYCKDIKFINSWMYVSNNNDIMRIVEEFFSELLPSVKRGSSEIFMRFGDNVYNVMIDQIDFYLAMKEFSNREILLRLEKIPSDMDRCFSYNTCIIMPRLSEQDIFRIVSRGMVLPPRTTLHVTHLKLIKKVIPIHIL